MNTDLVSDAQTCCIVSCNSEINAKSANLKDIFAILILKLILFNAVNYTTGRVDFDDSVHIVTVPAGRKVDDITVNIPIVDDDIDEADEGFILLLEIVDPAVAPFVDLSTRNASLGRIDDDDCKSESNSFASHIIFISRGF